ncbi:hypothetical protein, partial [Thermogemmatispora sp.]|uniref:hypothetical protein n=1 Tax=Thermogemmatispora sp. TaxID=1968838 RepID=UPI002579AF1C
MLWFQHCIHSLLRGNSSRPASLLPLHFSQIHQKSTGQKDPSLPATPINRPSRYYRLPVLRITERFFTYRLLAEESQQNQARLKVVQAVTLLWVADQARRKPGRAWSKQRGKAAQT